MNRYYDSHFDKQIVTIYPGEFYSTSESEMISTVLGSCISIALFDADAQIGGLNHFMLAKDSRIEGDYGEKLMGKFGEYAIELLIEDLVEKGARISRLSAKVFGGGNIFNLPSNVGSQVGEANSRFAFEFLQQKNIPVLSQNTGGPHSRKIFFDPLTGKVFMKFINRTVVDNNIAADLAADLMEKEKKYAEKIEKIEFAKVRDLFA